MFSSEVMTAMIIGSPRVVSPMFTTETLSDSSSSRSKYSRIWW